MTWLAENWALVTTIASVVIAALNAWGKTRYAKVVSALVLAIEEANASTTKELAKANTTKNGTAGLLGAIVAKLTKGA